MKKKNKTCRTYQKKFKEISNNKIEVQGIKYDKEVSEIIDIADFRQCYKVGEKARMQMPKYWFVSREGFLITIKGDKPRWVKPNLDTGRPQFKISHNGKTHSITTYDLVGLVWDSYISPDAFKCLNKQGLKSIGRNVKDRRKQLVLKVQGHHKDNSYIHESNLDSYISNNNPEQLQIITNREHIIIHSLTGNWNEDKKQFFRNNMLNVPDESPKVYRPDNTSMIPYENFKVDKVLNIYGDYTENDCYRTERYTFVSKDNRTFMEKNIKLLVHAANSLKNLSPDIEKNLIIFMEKPIFIQKN